MSPWHDSSMSSCGEAPHVAPFCAYVQETSHRRAAVPLLGGGGAAVTLLKGLGVVRCRQEQTPSLV